MKRSELIIWREVMPDVEKGVFGYISEHWGNKVLCYYIDNRLLERLDCGWDEHSYAKVCVESIPSSTNPNLFVNNIISKYPKAIHVFFGGLRHTLRKYLDSYLDQSSDTKIVIIAEKPVISGKLSKFKRISKKVLYHQILHKYQTDIDAFLAMGQKGVVRYKEYGYSKESIYPFMYNPLIADGDYKTQPDVVTINDPMKFLYL